MNALEIEQAISELALQPFDPAEFPYAFLAAFGNKEVTLKRLRSGSNNTLEAQELPCGEAMASAFPDFSNDFSFLLPLHVIDEAVQRTQDGSITSHVYDLQTARLVACGQAPDRDKS